MLLVEWVVTESHQPGCQTSTSTLHLTRPAQACLSSKTNCSANQTVNTLIFHFHCDRGWTKSHKRKENNRTHVKQAWSQTLIVLADLTQKPFSRETRKRVVLDEHVERIGSRMPDCDVGDCCGGLGWRVQAKQMFCLCSTECFASWSNRLWMWGLRNVHLAYICWRWHEQGASFHSQDCGPGQF